MTSRTPPPKPDWNRNPKTSIHPVSSATSRQSSVSSSQQDFRTPTPPTQSRVSSNPTVVSETPLQGRSPESTYATPQQSLVDIIKSQAEDALETLTKGQVKSSGQPAEARDKATRIIRSMISNLEQLKETDNTATNQPKKPDSAITKLEEKINQMAKDMDEIKAAILKPQTWATVTAANTPSPLQLATTNSRTQAKEQLVKQQQQKKQDLAKLEVVLTVDSHEPNARDTLADATYEDITKQLQATVQQAPITKKPKINAIQKLKSGDIKIICQTTDEAATLKNINWASAYNGLSIKKPRYGIVVHGIPREYIQSLGSDINSKEVTTILEQQNSPQNLTVTNISTLRRLKQEISTPTHTSIIIFTNDAEAADACINSGIIINYRRFPAEKYCPQLKLTQCYKCHKYGHTASKCKAEKATCGFCASQEHATNECLTKDSPHCINCKEHHPAWSPTCKYRDEEGKRLAAIRMTTSPYFSKHD
jgi:hypothetical protein